MDVAARLKSPRAALLVLLALVAVLLPPVAADASVLPSGFRETTVFSGLVNPTVVQFSPDGRVFVAEKSGDIEVFDSLTDPTPTTYANLRTNVHNFWDRGLLGMALHPGFPTVGDLYVLYTHDAAIGQPAPRWGVAGSLGDGCPTPPGPTGDGCVVSGRLSRIAPNGAETVLIEDWCQQYPSHSTGALAFGRDGFLYASAGDGASFNFADYGQDGAPVNPCGDPPGGVGGAMTPPTAQGGALRSQDRRTSGDPASLDGSIIRVNPADGSFRPVAYGMRNPFRMTVRPGTNELWFGDVGWGTWEEINRVADPRGAVENFGWPCYEGAPRQSGYDGLNLNVCENLYAEGAGGVVAPYYAYNHSAQVVAGESCPTGSSATAGVAFSGAAFPDAYDGSLFFADYNRDCIWVMRRGANGLPDPAQRQTFAAAAANPVNLVTGPDGNLYYPDFDGGTVRRIEFSGTPVADATATPAQGPAPLTVTLSGSSSTDPNGDPLTYAWDLDGDGAFDDATGATVSRTYANPGTYTAGLRVTDPGGASDTDTVAVEVSGNTAPSVTITAPAAGLRWKVGDPISFSGSATDPEQGTLPPSALTWRLLIQHCPSNCHEHTVQTWPGVASGSFAAPDHEYPSYLELEVTATDAGGLTDTEKVRLDPQTVALTFATNPAGLSLAFNSETTAAPFTRTVIVGSANSVTAVSPQTSGGTAYTFSSWSDGGAATHTVVAPATATTYTATYTAGTPTWQPYANVNFQPAAAPTVSGYLVDSGAVYGDRGGGRSYGWSTNLTTRAFDRDSARSPDQRYDTLVAMTRSGANGTWEMAVPNGSYRVRVVNGDATRLDSVYRTAVEGTIAVDGTPTTSQRWIEGTVDVNVTDGRLTISSAAGASNNKLCFVEISRAT